MKAEAISKSTGRKHAARIAIIVGLILLIPLVLTLLGDGIDGQGWNWKPGDFVFGFVMLFGTGLLLDYAARKLAKPSHRIIACIAIVIAFLLIWAELAVGIIGTPFAGS